TPCGSPERGAKSTTQRDQRLSIPGRLLHSHPHETATSELCSLNRDGSPRERGRGARGSGSGDPRKELRLWPSCAKRSASTEGDEGYGRPGAQPQGSASRRPVHRPCPGSCGPGGG